MNANERGMIAHLDTLEDLNDALEREGVALRKQIATLIKVLGYCASTLEMLCPDTAGTPAAQAAREVIKALEA